MRPTRLLAYGALVAIATAVAPAHAKDPRDLPGFESSHEPPRGDPFQLPEGIELEILSYNPFDLENTCKRPDAEPDEQPLPEEGVGAGVVRLCFQFRNTTQRRISVELPPGIITISSDQEVQNGLMFQSMEVEVPAGQFLFAPIKGDCMNTPRDAPGIGVRYTLGPVVDSADIREALGLLAGRDLRDPMVSVEAIGVLKPLYYRRPLTNEGREILLGLPMR